MKRITVPEPKIDLYNDGFEGHDHLSRAETGKKLSDLVERIDEPLVIALDGAWGSGKSHFLKCWVGYHKEHNEKTKTVYFDAFKHDYLDDPLVALTGEIARRFQAPPPTEAKEVETAPVQSRALEKLLQFGAFAGRNSGKIAVSFLAKQAQKALSEDDFDELSAEFKAALSDGISSIEGDAEALFDAKPDKAGTEEFWKEQRAKIASMEGFRLALKELTEPATKEQAQHDDLDEGDPTRKLVIVIDELDRCRPDYALQLLEIIKHFFNVPGVHFVLGVNLNELQNSVRARYGAEVDAETYLQKFVHLHFALPSTNNRQSDDRIWLQYFDAQCAEMGIDELWGDVLQNVRWLLHCVNIPAPDNTNRELSLRDVDRVLPILALANAHLTGIASGKALVLASLAIAKGLLPNVYTELRHSASKAQVFRGAFKLENISEEYQRDYYRRIFDYSFGGGTRPIRNEKCETQEEITTRNAFGQFGLHQTQHKTLYDDLAEKYLETFKLST